MGDDRAACDEFIDLLIEARQRVVAIRNDAKITGGIEQAAKEMKVLFRDFDEKFYDIQHRFLSCDD